MTSEGIRKWYAMSSPYGREQKAVELLKKEPDIDTYVPMERYERLVGRKKQERKITERPVIRNLLFIQSTEQRMRVLKAEHNTLIQFKMRRNGGATSLSLFPIRIWRHSSPSPPIERKLPT